MTQYKHKDTYFERAKREGLPSRASYKILEIQKKYKLIQPGNTVVDLGCAPGGWLCVMAEMVGESGKLIGIDLEPITIPLPSQVECIVGDIDDDSLQGKIRAMANLADVIVSDMSPKTTGIKFVDSLKSTQLAETAFAVCDDLLKEDGNFVTKIFPGGDFAKFKNALKARFKRCVQFVPDSTRKSSIETYLIGIGFKRDDS